MSHYDPASGGTRYTLDELAAMKVGTKLYAGEIVFTKVAGPKARCRHWIARGEALPGGIGECTTSYVEQFQFWPAPAQPATEASND